jgi:hypothetical protein
MNGFEKHGISHLSASSINLFGAANDVWVMQYVFGQRTGMGPAAWRGVCIEDAVVDTLLGNDEDKAIAAALAKFDKRYMIGDLKTTKERNMIEATTKNAVAELRQYGKPEFSDENRQEKISLTAKFDEFSIPVIGFLDLVFPEHGIVIDLKTSKNAPTSMSPEHQIQRCIYAKAKGNMAVKFLYATPKKTALLEDGDVATTMAEVKNTIARMEKFCLKVDKEDVRDWLPINKGTFYWNGSESLRKEFYGI